MELELDVGVMAGLSGALGDLTDEMRAHRRMRALETPADVSQNGSGPAPAAGGLGLDLGGPTAGYVWLLRGLSIGGVSSGTAAAGTGEVYTSPLPAAAMAALRDTLSLRVVASALPFVATFSSRMVVLQDPEHLTVVVVGGTSGQQYVASARFEQYATRARITEQFAL